jgi:hypothetical protein
MVMLMKRLQTAEAWQRMNIRFPASTRQRKGIAGEHECLFWVSRD